MDTSKLLIASVIVVSACTPNSTLVNQNATTTTSSTTTTAQLSTLPAGSRAAQIIFQSTIGGSFNTLQGEGNTQGTFASPGSGHPAVRIFNPDGTLQGSVSQSSISSPKKYVNWPPWLSSFEIGISGSVNTSAPNPNCATFSGSAESTAINCYLGPTTSPIASQCGAPLSQFRVSEVDCSTPTGGLAATSNGTGGPEDGVYLRAVFDRSNLGAAENLLVVLQYAASALTSAPSNPTDCFSNGQFQPERCSDFVWRAYLKHTSTEAVTPFLLLIPPTYSSVLGSGQPSGTNLIAKQFILPLASDSTLSVLQISRISSILNSNPSLLSSCTSSSSVSLAAPGNSPLCAGVVFYSITFYRI